MSIKRAAPKPFIKFELPKSPAKPGGAVTMAIPENPISKPKPGGPIFTTQAIGEEGGSPKPKPGGGAVTMAFPENGSAKPKPGGGMVTMAFPENGGGKPSPVPGKPGGMTTLALGEEGGGSIKPVVARIKARADALIKGGNVEFGSKAPKKSQIAGPEIPLKSERPFSYSAIPLKDGTFVIKKVLTGGFVPAKPGDGTYSEPISLGRSPRPTLPPGAMG